ncbi:MAG: NifB/NifX family molybdenum-iron cluster-binding protein [Chlorobiaceae bacterium]
MKVIVPLDEQAGQSSKISEHFGSAPFFAVADTDADSLEIIANDCMHHDHGQCNPPDFFSKLGVSALLCHGIEAGAVHRVQKMGITVYRTAIVTTLEEALLLFKRGTLKKVTPQDACYGTACHS